MSRCPKCGLISPPQTQRCDCGFDLARAATPQGQEEVARLKKRSLIRRDVLSGLLLFGIGYAMQLAGVFGRVPILTYVSLLAYVVSFVLLLMGLIRWINSKRGG